MTLRAMTLRTITLATRQLHEDEAKRW